MPQLVIRISWRKGLPLGICVSKPVGFLDLSRELRDKIYNYSLVSPEPITVWSGTTSSNKDVSESSRSTTVQWWRTVDTNLGVLTSLALGLLRCNQQVQKEAAGVIYRYNTFRFMGNDDWHTLYSFLELIGQENRQDLRSIEIQMRQPRHLWQYPDGTCTSMSSWPFREVVTQSAYAQSCTPLATERGCRMVEHLEPAIEACFRILGKNRPPLSLALLLNSSFLPGVSVMYDEQYPDHFSFTMDVPLMIGKCRQDLTAGNGMTSQVEILWKGECIKEVFTKHRKVIQDKGWVIIETEERYDHDQYKNYSMLFTLRLRETLASLEIGSANV